MGTFGAVPGIRPEQVEHCEADRGVGQQRHVVEPAPHAADQPGAPGGGASWWWSIRARTKIAEQADLHLALRPGTDVVLAWAVAAELERRGAPRPRLHRAARRGLRGLHGAGAAAGRSSAAARIVRGGRRPTCARFAEWYADALARRDQRGQRARAQPERRQRHPRDLRAAGAGRQVRRAGRRPRQRRGLRVSQDAAAAAAARPRAAGHAHAQHRRRRRAPARPDAGAAHQGACSSTTTTRSSCTRTRTGMRRGPRARGPLRRRHRRRDDRQHGATATSCCPPARTSSTTTSSPPTASTGCSAPSRSSRRRARRCPTPRSSGGWPRASASPSRASRPPTPS